jgi:hypothetical protein
VIWAKYLFSQLFTVGDEESGILEVNHLNKEDPRNVFERCFDADVRLIKKELNYVVLDEYESLPRAPRSRVEIQQAKKFPTQLLISMWFYSYHELLQ